MIERVLHEKPEVRRWLKHAREDSEILGVPAWFLLTLNDEARRRSWWGALEIIHALRNDAEEATAETQAIAGVQTLNEEDEALVAEVEAKVLADDLDRLKPVLDGHPEMTIGEAARLLEAETERTIRELDSPEAEDHA
jgi:hypothetical protein